MAVLKAVSEEPEFADVYMSDDTEPQHSEEYVWLYEADADRDWKTIRGGASHLPMQEDINVELRVFVLIGTDSVKPSEDRAFEISDAVEDALRDDPDLNGVLLHQRVKRIRQQQLVHDNRRGVHVLMSIYGEGRI